MNFQTQIMTRKFEVTDLHFTKNHNGVENIIRTSRENLNSVKKTRKEIFLPVSSWRIAKNGYSLETLKTTSKSVLS